MNQIINKLQIRVKTNLHNAAFGMLAIMSSVGSVVPMTAPNVHAQVLLNELVAEYSVADPLSLPVAGTREPSRTMKIPVSAYNSLPNQTDSTPFNTADGTYVRDGLIAANFLPLGTRVRFPELYGDKEFIVKDRMNKRYNYKADIWMEEYSDAIQFGVHYTTIEIF
ncbi:3D domain-containing protein [Candidatus Uhrbacteria bacterium]|nr:3D domain-containing protein [Candidatus Uhrbacteria bacterium]